MIGDWIFISMLVVFFIIIIILSIIIINSAQSITPSLRKTDSGMRNAYNELQSGAYIALVTAIVGIIILFFSILFIVISPWTRFIDKIARFGKIIIKELYGVITFVLIFISGWRMGIAANAIMGSRTYKVSKLGARKELDASIASINLAAMVYYILAGLILLIFILIGVYDSSKVSKDKIVEEMEMENIVEKGKEKIE